MWCYVHGGGTDLSAADRVHTHFMVTVLIVVTVVKYRPSAEDRVRPPHSITEHGTTPHSITQRRPTAQHWDNGTRHRNSITCHHKAPGSRQHHTAYSINARPSVSYSNAFFATIAAKSHCFRNLVCVCWRMLACVGVCWRVLALFSPCSDARIARRHKRIASPPNRPHAFT
jgi:hypothetical protein